MFPFRLGMWSLAFSLLIPQLARLVHLPLVLTLRHKSFSTFLRPFEWSSEKAELKCTSFSCLKCQSKDWTCPQCQFYNFASRQEGMEGALGGSWQRHCCLHSWTTIEIYWINMRLLDGFCGLRGVQKLLGPTVLLSTKKKGASADEYVPPSHI
jgi:hypothetical protein